MDLGRRDKVDNDAVAVEDAKDLSKEAMGKSLFVASHVEKQDLVFDGDGGGLVAHFFFAEVAVGLEDGVNHGGAGVLGVAAFGENDGAVALGVFYVFDADGDAGVDDLVHGEGMDHFAAIVGKLGRFFRGDDGQQSGGRDLARVGGEDAVHLFPDLELDGVQTDGAQGCTKVCVASTNLSQKGAGHDAKEAGDHGHSVAALEQSLAHALGKPVVPGLVQLFRLCSFRVRAFDNVFEADQFRVYTLLKFKRSDVSMAIPVTFFFLRRDATHSVLKNSCYDATR